LQGVGSQEPLIEKNANTRIPAKMSNMTDPRNKKPSKSSNKHEKINFKSGDPNLNPEELSDGNELDI
jgi:hypothetical protein